jgi:hypothetical protein
MRRNVAKSRKLREDIEGLRWKNGQNLTTLGLLLSSLLLGRPRSNAGQKLS